MAGTLKYKRIYEPEEADDGTRILIDRLWPRGLSKEKADLDEWKKEIAPDRNLLHAYHKHAEDYEQFQTDYLNELENSAEAEQFVLEIQSLLKKGNVTLLYGSKDKQHNNAAVLREWLDKKIAE